jgi:TRAP-type C4-dicarboxylate transport system permease small subunit
MQSQEKASTKPSSHFDRIIGAFMFFGAAVLAFLMISVCWDVVARTFIGKPLTWVLEFTEYGLLYMTFLCATWVLKHEGHVTNDVLFTRLSPRNQALCIAITSILGAVICMLLTWFGAHVSLEKLLSGAYQPTPIEPPDFPIFAIIPIGCSLLAIQFLRRAKKNLAKWKTLRASTCNGDMSTHEMLRS